MNFWTALDTIGRLAQFIATPEITSDTVSGVEVIYALGGNGSAQYDLLRNDGVACIGTLFGLNHNWHQNPDRCLTIAECEAIEKKNKPFFDEVKAELKREGSLIYHFDESEWVLTPDTIAKLVGHIRLCKECLDKGLCLN